MGCRRYLTAKGTKDALSPPRTRIIPFASSAPTQRLPACGRSFAVESKMSQYQISGVSGIRIRARPGFPCTRLVCIRARLKEDAAGVDLPYAGDAARVLRRSWDKYCAGSSAHIRRRRCIQKNRFSHRLIQAGDLCCSIRSSDVFEASVSPGILNLSLREQRFLHCSFRGRTLGIRSPV